MTHLFFADNSLLFYRANQNESQEIMHILKQYEVASGQRVNMEKSSIFFSSNTSERAKNLVKQTLNVQSGLENDKYLGLPIMIGRDK